jgi:hypothetical protein
MSCTRFSEDSARIRKQNEIITFQGRYQLEAPGPGANLPFQEDPHIRLTKWGANACLNSTNVESDLRGLSTIKKQDTTGGMIGTKSLSHCIPEYKSVAAPQVRATFGTAAAFVEDTRITCPAWTYRDIEFSQWHAPLPYAIHAANVDFCEDGMYTRNSRFTKN